MKKQRFGIVILLVVITAVVFCALFMGAAPASKSKILIETPLYKEPDFDSEKHLEKLPQNESVEILEEEVFDANGRGWLYVSYTAYKGYVPSGYVYYTTGNDDYNVIVAKATTSKMSEKINVYSYFDEKSEVVGTLVDGEKINLIDDGEDYGEFRKVVFGGGYYFIRSINVTTGMTLNQKVALIIIAVLVAFLIIGAVLGYTLYKRKKKNAKPSLDTTD